MTKTAAKLVAVALVVLAAFWAYKSYRITYPNQEHTMTELTRSMHPYCVGRFLVDVPVQAKLGQLSQRISHMGDINVETSVSKAAYLNAVSKKEAELRAQFHKTERNVLHEVWHPVDRESSVIFYRDDYLNVLDFSILAYLWHDNRLVTFHYGASNDKVQEAKDDLVRAFALIQPRADDQIPTGPGTCVESAFIPGTGYRSESVTWSLTIPEYPDLRITFSIDSTVKPETEGLLDRVGRHMKAVDIQFPEHKEIMLRKGARGIGDLSGEELVQILKGDKNDPNDPKDSFLANWEFGGIANSMKQPKASIDMNYTIPSDPKSPRLNQEELLALWDRVVGSLRPRPNAF